MGLFAGVRAIFKSKKAVLLVYEPGHGRRIWRCEYRRSWLCPWVLSLSLQSRTKAIPDLVGERMMELLSKDSLTKPEKVELDYILDCSGDVIVVRQ